MSKLMTSFRSTDPKESSFEDLKQRIHGKLVDKLDRYGFDVEAHALANGWWR